MISKSLNFIYNSHILYCIKNNSYMMTMNKSTWDQLNYEDEISYAGVAYLVKRVTTTQSDEHFIYAVSPDDANQFISIKVGLIDYSYNENEQIFDRLR